MDKLAVNQQIVLLRNVVKIARRYMYLELRKSAVFLRKKIKKLPTENEKQLKLLNDKLNRVNESLSLIKSVSLDAVSKHALKSTEPLQKILSNTKLSCEQKLIAKVANSSSIQKHVKKFREEHKDWELYLNTLFELWDEKKKIKKNISTSENENVDRDDNQITERFAAKSMNKESFPKSSKVLEKKITPKKKQKSHLSFNSESEKFQVTNESQEINATEETNSNREDDEPAMSNDDFFINKRSLFPNVESTDQDEFPNSSKFKPKFRKVEKIGKLRDSLRQQKDSKNEKETIHPSWEAKKKQKQSLKIDLNNSQSKKIRFDD